MVACSFLLCLAWIPVLLNVDEGAHLHPCSIHILLRGRLGAGFREELAVSRIEAVRFDLSDRHMRLSLQRHHSTFGPASRWDVQVWYALAVESCWQRMRILK